jgi:hypothetical protein
VVSDISVLPSHSQVMNYLQTFQFLPTPWTSFIILHYPFLSTINAPTSSLLDTLITSFSCVDDCLPVALGVCTCSLSLHVFCPSAVLATPYV